MYLPQSFEENRIDVLHAMMRANPLATLITAADSGIVADHVPVLTRSIPPTMGLLCGHIARANPLWRHHDPEREALAIFQGPQAYISPSLYPSKKDSGEVVPTWDYAIVHVYGTLRFLHEPAWLLDLVSDLTITHENGRSEPWNVNDAPAAYIDKMLRAIVGFEFSVTRILGKWKISQNRSAADQQGVVAGLSAATDPQSRAIAAMLLQRESSCNGAAEAPP